jgi:hypothetical protein
MISPAAMLDEVKKEILADLLDCPRLLTDEQVSASMNL